MKRKKLDDCLEEIYALAADGMLCNNISRPRLFNPCRDKTCSRCRILSAVYRAITLLKTKEPGFPGPCKHMCDSYTES